MAESRPRVWVSQPLLDAVIAPLHAQFELITTPHVRQYSAAEIAHALADVDGALVTLGERIGVAELAGAARLKVVANVAVGHNNLDLDAFAAAGVLATNTPDVLTETTADLGFALLMAAARRVGESERWLRAGHWQQWSFDGQLGQDIHGSTLGIIGMGRIGQAIARRGALGFGMRVLYHNRHPLPAATESALGARLVDLDTLLRDADHVLLALPYTADNHHLIDAAALAQMKPAATLVNIARGGLVDEQALAAALTAGRLGAAGLDVFEGEPALCPALLAAPNSVLTPHIGSATAATRTAMLQRAVDNLVAGLGLGMDAGHPRDLVGRVTACKRPGTAG
jgi:gluconate 2-dehydrogenase